MRSLTTRSHRRDAITFFAQLGVREYADVTIAPVSVSRFDIDFGFIAPPPEHEDEELRVTLEPGDERVPVLGDSGGYDT